MPREWSALLIGATKMTAFADLPRTCPDLHRSYIAGPVPLCVRIKAEERFLASGQFGYLCSASVPESGHGQAR